ncbi:MAG: AAA family ATPase [Verrucomicrobia bacterium]|nr:AAA family ATPase [Verrucomicrobiota bacterium]
MNDAAYFEPDEETMAMVAAHNAGRSKTESSGGPGQTIVADPLPGIENAAFALASIDSYEIPKEIVHGLLHRGSKGMLGGGSKTFKTWTLLDLATSVATGNPFWDLETEQASVLFVNLEIQTPFLWRRVQAIVEAKGVDIPTALDVWNLRGYSASAHILLPRIIERVQTIDYGLIVLDPVYKILGERDENNAGHVADLLNEMESVAVKTGAAIVFGAHFAKGNASQKETIDRVSGSGSFARDPDTIIMMTPHEESDAFTVESILRNMPQPNPFVVRRQHPLMVRDSSLDPVKLKQPKGGATKRTIEEILAVLPKGGLRAAEWAELVAEETGIKERRFYQLKAEAEAKKQVTKSPIDGRFLKQ